MSSLDSPKNIAENETYKGRVLVVDDEKINRAVLCRLLEQDGFETVQATSGIEALDQIKTTDFDLVMLDIVMPEMGGFEALQEIRKVFRKLDLPVIMVTADSISEQIVRAFELGANDYILKPHDPAVTMARVGMHLQFKRSREALEKSEERYSLVAEGTNDGLWDWNVETGDVYYSPRWYSLLDVEPPARPTIDLWFDRIHSEDHAPFKKEIENFKSGKTTELETELRMQHSDGSFRWTVCRGTSVRDDSGAALRMAGSLTDITNGKVADALTGLPNRVLFLDRLSRCAARRARDNFQFALLYLDIDNFKLVNDSLGHEAGDHMLVAIARRLEGCLRESDSFICRLGGDEFVILLEDVGSLQEPVVVAKRILDSIDAAVMIGDGREMFASLSVGIAFSGDDFEDTASMMQAADTAMYRAKSAGKSCYRVFDPAMKRDAKERLDIENELRRSIEREDFEVYYQPIVDLETSRVVGLEALVRWTHPRNGRISPAQFIPIAEETGMINAIGQQVLKTSCSQLASWRSEDPRFDDVTLSVNLSSVQIRQPDIVQTILEVVDEANLNPGDLRLEVTESVIMKNPKHGAKVLANLSEAGIRVAIDDFGTGYSSLAYLCELSPHSLKIDRSFIDGIDASADKKSIVKAILALCEGMNLNVVAEGIETQDQQQLLCEMGCELAQGYLFAKPLVHDEVPALVHSFDKHAAPQIMPPLSTGDASSTVVPTPES